MKLDDAQRFDLLKLEMGLIQSTLDKYDDLIFRNRNWFITLWVGIVGLSFTINATELAIALSILYLTIEGMMRHQYWYKYVLRYRSLRDAMNDNDTDLSELPLYDLTNKYSSQSRNDQRSPGRAARQTATSDTIVLLKICRLSAYRPLRRTHQFVHKVCIAHCGKSGVQLF